MALTPQIFRRVGDRVAGASAVVMPVGLHLRVTPEQFAAFCQANPLLRLERTAAGRLIIMWPAGLESGGQNAGLTAQLWLWNQTSGAGKVVDSSSGFTLPNGAILSPDAAWIAQQRWQALPKADRQGFASIVPDFVAELRSPTDRLGLLRAKIRQYIEQGVRLAWLIDPVRRRVEVSRPGAEVVVLDRPTTLGGEDVLPGFVLDLRGILFD